MFTCDRLLSRCNSFSWQVKAVTLRATWSFSMLSLAGGWNRVDRHKQGNENNPALKFCLVSFKQPLSHHMWSFDFILLWIQKYERSFDTFNYILRVVNNEHSRDGLFFHLRLVSTGIVMLLISSVFFWYDFIMLFIMSSLSQDLYTSE